MPSVTVRLFAGLRERAGTGSTVLELPDGAVAGDVWALLELGEQPPGIAFAINRQYADADAPLAEGVEVALIPPVSGGSDEPRIGVTVTADPIDIAAAHARANDERAGAQAAFTGTVRNATRGKEVVRLEYEAYEEMAVEELERIARQAAADHELLAVEIVHRTGIVMPGEASVVIVSTSRHRPSALAATQWIIEQLKVSVPIWKREVYADGAVWVGRGS
jgi:molybdopterin synthase catalytic subunit